MTIIINGNVTFNGSVTVNNLSKQNEYWDNYEKIDKVKRDFVDILFNKRYSAKWGGHDGWEEMIKMYRIGKYKELRERIATFKDSKSKEKALENLDAIIEDDNLFWQKLTAQN